MSCASSNVYLSSQSSYSSPKTSFPLQARNLPIVVSTRDRICTCMSSSSTPPPSTFPANDGFLFLRNPVLLPSKDEDKEMGRREYLLEKTRRKLQTSNEKLKLIDTIQRMGLGYYMEDDINDVLQNESSDVDKDEDLLTMALRLPLTFTHNRSLLEDEDLFITALHFRLLRHNGLQATTDVFLKFMDENGRFKECLAEDEEGMLSLYEASYMGAKGEEILEEAKKFSKKHLEKVADAREALELPRHLRMGRLEARRYIQQYAKLQTHDPQLLELALLDYNRVQAQHQLELDEITRWWKQLGLVEKLSFARDRPLECFLWSVGLLPDPKYSACRIELAKTIAILLVIDDIFDTYGQMDELLLFTHAIQRWDLEAMETLPEYMKICYMALYNTTNEICYKVLKANGWSVLPYLKSTWIDMIEGFMVEAKWFNGGSAPNLEEYIENGVSTAGAYMALVHLFFLIGEGVTDQNARLLMTKPYPKLFSAAGRILRLWDDLGTANEEQERGDLASSIRLLMKERNLDSDEEGRSCILEEIHELWKDLNVELIAKNEMPLAIIRVALDMARASQVVYKHEEDTYFSSVDNYVEALFFTPLVV